MIKIKHKLNLVNRSQLLIIFVLLGTLLTGFYIGTQYSKITTRSKEVSQQYEEVENMLLYKNEKLDISLRHYPNWTVKVISDESLNNFAIKIQPIDGNSVSIDINSEGYYGWGIHGEPKYIPLNFLGDVVNVPEFYSPNYREGKELRTIFHRFTAGSNQMQIFYSTGSPLTEDSNVGDYEKYKMEAKTILSTVKFD